MREEITANTCFGTAATVRAHIDPFFAGLATRRAEVIQRCRTAGQSRADALDADRVAALLSQAIQEAASRHVDSTSASL